MIKAIETVYNGYRFRSRLEARWAVFFDALGIEYQYELDGFDLGEMGWYLPDFWLPQQKYWLEIKGPRPLPNEMEKVCLLAKGTQTNSFILFGTPWVDPDVIDRQYQLDQWCQYTAMGFFGDHYNITGNGQFLHIHRFHELRDFLIGKRDDEGYTFSLPIPAWRLDESTIQQLIDLDKEYFRKRYGETHYLWIYNDSTYRGAFKERPPGILFKWAWCERNNKLLLDSTWNDIGSEFQTERLLRAYQAARQARFEHGETPNPADLRL
jgi:hypothetical protein